MNRINGYLIWFTDRFSNSIVISQQYETSFLVHLLNFSGVWIVGLHFSGFRFIIQTVWILEIHTEKFTNGGSS